MADLLTAFHDRWSAAGLEWLVPSERFFTGPVPSGTDLPFASLSVNGERIVQSTAAGDEVIRSLVRVDIRAAGLAEAHLVSQAVRGAYDRQAIDLDGLLHCLARRTDQTPEGQGLWRAGCEFEILWQRSPV